MAEITAQMLMQRDVMSRMFVMDPMRVIPMLVLVLCESSISIPSLFQELRSLECCFSTRERFLWGRNADGLTTLALLWTFVTLFVARFPSRICGAIAFETWIVDSSLDLMSLGLWSLVTLGFERIKHVHPQLVARVKVLGTLLLNKREVPLGEEC